MSIIWPSIDLMVAWKNLNLPTANPHFLPKVSIGRKTMDCMVTVTNKGRAHLEEKEFEVSQLCKPFVHNLNVEKLLFLWSQPFPVWNFTPFFFIKWPLPQDCEMVFMLMEGKVVNTKYVRWEIFTFILFKVCIYVAHFWQFYK